MKPHATYPGMPGVAGSQQPTLLCVRSISPTFRIRSFREQLPLSELPLRLLSSLETIFRDVAAIAVIFVRQEFSRHHDFDAVALRIGEALYHHVEINR